jgi:hypothetical protein
MAVFQGVRDRKEMRRRPSRLSVCPFCERQPRPPTTDHGAARCMSSLSCDNGLSPAGSRMGLAPRTLQRASVNKAGAHREHTSVGQRRARGVWSVMNYEHGLARVNVVGLGAFEADED